MGSPKRSRPARIPKSDAFGTARLSVWENGNILTLCPSNRDRHDVVDTVLGRLSDSELYSMADYLNARARGRSESVNTDASSTVVSPLPTPGPTTNQKLTPLLGTKFPINTILKSHGRPPWYYMGYAPEG
jgi:virulence-associated protein VagC